MSLLPRKFVACLLLACIFVLPSTIQADDPATPDFGDVVERGMEMWHVPGMAVAVVSKDGVTFSRGFGTTSVEAGEPVDEHTEFAIASTTKAMVVAGLLMLADEGKLTLDDPVIKDIPELHFNAGIPGETVTVRDILAHRTGLPSTDFWSFFQNMPLKEQIERLRQVPPESPIRTRLIYQNTMFELAGLLIERTSGMAWQDFLTQRLWHPIGMQETYGMRGAIPAGKRHVKPHFYVDEKVTVTDWDLPAEVADAAGSVWSSLHDMSLWAQFLLRGGVTAGGDRLITETAFAQMFEPQQIARPEDFYPTVELTQPHWRTYGLGWFQQDFQGRMINFHTGSLSGLIAIIGLDRANDKAVIVLGNRDHAEMRHALLWEVMDTSTGESRRDWNQDVFDLYAKRAAEGNKTWEETQSKRLSKTRPSQKLDAYAGTYRSVVNGDLVINHSGKDLELKTATQAFPVTHWQLETFMLSRPEWEFREFISFKIGLNGTVDSFELFGDQFKRVKTEE